MERRLRSKKTAWLFESQRVDVISTSAIIFLRVLVRVMGQLYLKRFQVMHFLFVLSIVPLFSLSLLALPLEVDVAAESAILMNADTGVILFEKNAHEKKYPASVTKIATAAYVLNATNTSLEERVLADHDAVCSVTEDAKKRSGYTLPSYWLVPGASHMGLKRGEVMTMRDLLHGMMLASGDDASNAIAMHIAGSVPEFMNLLNTYLTSIGCKNTYFNNPHGLYHPKHQTTAYDMAILTCNALKNSTFCEIISTTRYTRPHTNKQESSTLLQTNKLLHKGKFYYPKAIGVKTGYIAAAQNTFVAAARHNNRLLVAVLLKVKDRADMFNDSVKLFEMAFNQEKIQKLVLERGPQSLSLVLEGAKKQVKTYTLEDLSLEYYPAEEPSYKTILVWDEVALPVKKDQRVGEIRLQSESGAVLQKVSFYAQENVDATWAHWFLSFF